MVSFPRHSRNSRLNGKKLSWTTRTWKVWTNRPQANQPAAASGTQAPQPRRLGLPCPPFPPVLVRATDHGRTTMIRRSLLLPLLAVLLVGCDPAPKAAGDTAAAPEATALPLFDTFGDLHHDVASRVPAAQRYFDQGLRMAYGFNHEAAGRAFAEAARLDPQCAMCVWGQALVLGPNINLPMDPAHAKDATALAARAASLAATARPVDRALIQALQLRYADPAPQDRAPLDRAYAEAMARVVAQFPEDDDAATLYAEALMDLSPWAYWEKDGTPARFTPRLLGELERVLARNPRHIGAMHYYIHATESSPEPQRAEPHADALAALAPGS